MLSPLVVASSTHAPPGPTKPPSADRKPPWWQQTYTKPASCTLGAHAAGNVIGTSTDGGLGAMAAAAGAGRPDDELTPRTRYSREVGNSKYSQFVTGLQSSESHPSSLLQAVRTRTAASAVPSSPCAASAATSTTTNKKKMRRTPADRPTLPSSTPSPAAAAAAAVAAAAAAAPGTPRSTGGRRTNPFASQSAPLYPCATVSTQGPRPTNEDAYQVMGSVGGVKDMTFYGVYDGHGGHATIDYCAHHLVENFAASAVFPADPAAALAGAFVATDTGFCTTRASSAAPRDGACVVAVVAHRRSFVVAHVGDCRAVLLRRGGVAKQLTNDHKPHGKAEAARMRAAGGELELSKLQDVLSYSRSIGDAGQTLVVAQPDVTRWALEDGDEMLVLATDGLWDVVQCAELYKLAVHSNELPDPRTVADRLVSEAQFRESSDNVTVMCIDLRLRTVWPETPPGGVVAGAMPAVVQAPVGMGAGAGAGAGAATGAGTSTSEPTVSFEGTTGLGLKLSFPATPESKP